MSYQVHITSTAEHDIMRAADYIEFTLKNPDAADNLLDAATEQIGSLADLPQKFRLVDDPVLASWGIRFVIINNYLAFYTIDEEKQTVIIVRFLYQKSNWTSILRQGFSLILRNLIFYAGSLFSALLYKQPHPLPPAQTRLPVQTSCFLSFSSFLQIPPVSLLPTQML